MFTPFCSGHYHNNIHNVKIKVSTLIFLTEFRYVQRFRYVIIEVGGVLLFLRHTIKTIFYCLNIYRFIYISSTF